MDPRAGRRSQQSTFLSPQHRLHFEERRLKLRLLLLIAPLLLYAYYGEVAAATAAILGAIVVGSTAAIWTLLRYAPSLFLRLQLAFRVVDVVLIYVGLFGIHQFSDGRYDVAYILAIISTTATHGRPGVVVSASAASVAVLVNRLHLSGLGLTGLGPGHVGVTLFYALVFFLAGGYVYRLMQESAEIVEERERAWRDELAHQNDELRAVNEELQAFSYSVSHDLRAPLRSIDGFSKILLDKYAERLDEAGRRYVQKVRSSSQRMGQLIDDLLHLSRLTRKELHREMVDLTSLAQAVAEELHQQEPDRDVRFRVEDGIVARGDRQLLRVVLDNLLGNAWKFTRDQASPEIAFGAATEGGRTVYYVSDNGVGFDMAYADQLFSPFQRLHSDREFEGTGIGLATVARVIRRHGGRIWAESVEGEGTTIHFTLEGGRPDE